MNAADVLDLVERAAPSDITPGRRAAAERFRAQGWPTRADEAWHYTDLNAALKSFDLGVKTAKLDLDHLLPATTAPRIVFVDGTFDAAASTASSYVGRYDAGTETARDSALPMVALNAAIATDGVSIDIPAGVAAGTLFLISMTAPTSQAVVAPLHRITLGAGASLTVIEIVRGAGRYLHNAVVEITLSETAVLQHYRLQDEALDAVNVTTSFVTIGEGARYDSFTLNCGAKLSRHEVHATLTSPAISMATSPRSSRIRRHDAHRAKPSNRCWPGPPVACFRAGSRWLSQPRRPMAIR
jgi:Fe-S cluster assembly protein SufD